jgi:hypothetical protein
MNTETEHGERHEKKITIIVEVSKHDHRKVEFDRDRVTGRDIKQAAHVPLETDLAARRHGQLELVTDDETVTIHEGDHFVVLPIGSIS